MVERYFYSASTRPNRCANGWAGQVEVRGAAEIKKEEALRSLQEEEHRLKVDVEKRREEVKEERRLKERAQRKNEQVLKEGDLWNEEEGVEERIETESGKTVMRDRDTEIRELAETESRVTREEENVKKISEY